jgi:hypothetical protein
MAKNPPSALFYRTGFPMTTLAQLDAAIAADATQEATLTGAVKSLSAMFVKLNADAKALADRIADSPSSPVSDFTSEANALAANTAKNAEAVAAIQDAVLAAQALDTQANPPAAAVAAGATAGPASPPPAVLPVSVTGKTNADEVAPGLGAAADGTGAPRTGTDDYAAIDQPELHDAKTDQEKYADGSLYVAGSGEQAVAEQTGYQTGYVPNPSEAPSGVEPSTGYPTDTPVPLGQGGDVPNE